MDIKEEIKEEQSFSEPKIVKTDEGAKDGQNKCPKCGATDISTNTTNGKLRCNFCRFEFEAEKIQGMEEDITQLSGDTFGSGAQNIQEESNDVITLKCTSCGAEVVIDTNKSNEARCHWCRNKLSINEQVPNGAIPDVVLPFGVNKEADSLIGDFVGKRKFFAHPKFTKEFTTENVMGVYFPYMVVDLNTHATFSGQGEHQTRSYTVNKSTYYDADLYQVDRDFDLTIEGLTIESSSDKLGASSNKTNNVINAIMPFDVENCVKYNSHYLSGFTSEKRDTNIDDLHPLVMQQAKDIARYSINDSLSYYGRGVRWDKQNLDIKGTQWKTAYLPVWLYSYQQVKSEDDKLLHYVALNARTKEIMGSVPIHQPKLIATSAFVEVFGGLLTLLIDFEYEAILFASGFAFYFIMYMRYRNWNARHYHEKETKTKRFNLNKGDVLIKRLKRLSSSRMNGANNRDVNY